MTSQGEGGKDHYFTIGGGNGGLLYTIGIKRKILSKDSNCEKNGTSVL